MLGLVAGIERVAWLSLSAVIVAGCGGAVTVQGEVVQPAQVPVRAFPRILVTAPNDPESQDLALAVARHLALGRSTVDQLEPGAIRELREAGRIERTTAVVELRTTLVRRDQPGWSRSDGLDCGPVGCVEATRTTVRDVPVLQGQVYVKVADGPSGRSLQEVAISEEESGGDVLGMRLRVLERLAQRTLAMLDQRIERVPVHLYPVAHAGVQRALDAVREGRWSEGRRRLEELVRSEAFRELPADQRALVLYDLGQTRRFDAGLPADVRFPSAMRALTAAVRLVPHPLYAQAIADLEQHRRSREMVREQQEAMAHNFALSRPTDTPEPPERYRD